MTEVSVDFDTLPDELKGRDQWLLWDADAERRQPFTLDGQSLRPASWTQPSAWLSFEEAREAAESIESVGVGYVLANTNEDHPRGIYGGLDLDGCVSDGSPVDWLPGLKPFFEEGAYVEFSPSGTGIHIPLVGFEPPEWWSDINAGGDHEGVEAYGSKFFAFTGDTLRGSGDEIANDGEYVEDWLKGVYDDLDGGQPWAPDDPHPDDREVSTPTSDTGNAKEIARDVDALDARDVAERTIVHGWNDDVSTSGDNRAFYPTWGPNCAGRANIVDRDGWTDTGTDSGSGGPLEMAAIDMGELNHSGCSWGDVSGELWWDAVDHLRSLGFALPEFEEEIDDEPAADPSSTETWETVRTYYQDSDTQDKHARQAAVYKLLNDDHFATPIDTERVWKYDRETGVYEPDGEPYIQERLADGLKAYYSQHERNEIVGKVRARTYIDRDEFDGSEDDHLLCCANGVLDLETRDLTDHSPEHLFTRAVPVEYDPEAAAPDVESFLDDITRRNADKQTLLEMIGAALWPGYEHSKFMILFGEGANGKSTYFETVEALLGSENVSGWELQKFSENRFATSDLVGKFANIAPDMPGTKLTELGTLKTLTGGDTTMGEDKGQPAFEFVNQATLMFGANRPPVIPEASRAIERRIVPIRLPFNFTPEDDGNPDARDRQVLLSELTSDDELSGLLNLALDGLDRLRDQGDVSLPESHAERLEYYEQFSDPIKEFRINGLENSRGTRVPKSAVYDAYKRFCREHGYAVKDNRIFWRTLRKTTLTYDESRPQIDGERVRVLNDTKFTEIGLEHAPPSIVDAAADDEEDSLGATSLQAARPGYADLTVRVDTVEPEDETMPMEWSGVFTDETGTVDAIDWTGTDVAAELEVGECYHLEKAKIGYGPNGEDQVELTDGVTTAEPIQHGVGYSPEGDAGTNEQLGAAADGGTDGLRSRVISLLRERGGPLRCSVVAGELKERPEVVQDRLRLMSENGDLIEGEDGYRLNQ